MYLKKTKTHCISIHGSLPGDRRNVLALLSRIEDFPAYVPNIRESRIIKQNASEVLSEWLVETDGLPIRWRQKTTFDARNFSINFEAVAGDLEKFEGMWELKKGEGNSTEVNIIVRLRLGIPVPEQMVSDELEFRIKKIFKTILEALEEKLVEARYARKDGKLNPGLNSFVVMGHPYNFHHLMKFFQVYKPDVYSMTPEFLMKIFELAPAYRVATIDEFRSKTGKKVKGYFVMCPLIPDMAMLTPEVVLPKVIDGCRVGERLGAGILALGGFTSVVGERYFQQLRNKVRIPITTGNAFTVAMVLAGVRKACDLMGKNLKKSKVVIIGGTGDIGSACARSLAFEAKDIVLTGRTRTTLEMAQGLLASLKGAKIHITTENNDAVREADIIVAAASAAQPVVDTNMIKPGTIVCDVGYPKNISHTSKHRSDIFVFSGGLSTVPTPFDMGFDLGLPNPNIIYGCFAESIILCMEERYENFSEGKGKLTPEKVEWIAQAGKKHGFELAPFYWGNELIDEERISTLLSKAVVY